MSLRLKLLWSAGLRRPKKFTEAIVDENKGYDKTSETHRIDGIGWLGLRRGDKRQRHRPGAQAQLRRIAEQISEHAHSYLRTIRRAARRPDGQQRSGPPEHRRGAYRAHGHHPHRRPYRQQTIAKRAAVPASDGTRAHAAIAPDGFAQRWRRALPHPSSVRAAGNG